MIYLIIVLLCLWEFSIGIEESAARQDIEKRGRVKRLRIFGSFSHDPSSGLAGSRRLQVCASNCLPMLLLAAGPTTA